MTMGKFYINFQYEREPIETLDEHENHREALQQLREYRMAYRNAPCRIWISKRATKEWYGKC